MEDRPGTIPKGIRYPVRYSVKRVGGLAIRPTTGIKRGVVSPVLDGDGDLGAPCLLAEYRIRSGKAERARKKEEDR